MPCWARALWGITYLWAAEWFREDFADLALQIKKSVEVERNLIRNRRRARSNRWKVQSVNTGKENWARRMSAVLSVLLENPTRLRDAAIFSLRKRWKSTHILARSARGIESGRAARAWTSRRGSRATPQETTKEVP